MNSFKQEWLEATQDLLLPPYNSSISEQHDQRNIFVERQITQRKKEAGMAIGMMLSTHAAQSQVAGRLGMALRVGGRLGVRVIPVAGAVLTAYDVYMFLKD
jgi:hypothetical protein